MTKNRLRKAVLSVLGYIDPKMRKSTDFTSCENSKRQDLSLLDGAEKFISSKEKLLARVTSVFLDFDDV